MRLATKVIIAPLAPLALMVGLSPPRALWGGQTSGDPQTSETAVVRQTTTFGTLGIVDGQSVRLSAIRSGDVGANICHVDLNFFDLAGNRQGDGVSTDLSAGHGTFLDLSRADVEPQPNDPRAQIYAVVEVVSEPAGTGDPKDAKPACHVAMSIEIIDQADGHTQVYQGAFTADVKVGDTALSCCICCKVNSHGGCAVGGLICNSCTNCLVVPPCPHCS